MNIIRANDFDRAPNILREDFIKAVEQTYETLATQQDLSPQNTVVNTCLGDFVNAVLACSANPYSADFLKDPKIEAIRPSLLKILSKAEFEMERYFATYFAAQENLTDEGLDYFWYRDCYRELVAAEIGELDTLALDNDKGIAFVGSGPLPLTAIEYYLQTGKNIACFDTDEAAVIQSRQIIKNMGLEDRITVHHQSGEEADYGVFSVVMVASLVTDKQKTLSRIRETAPDAHVAVRSVEGIKAMLYEVVAREEFEAQGLAYWSSTQDEPTTINTTLFFKPAKPAAV